MKGANGMDASTAKHQAKLAEWRTLVAECRSSGKSVRAWCAEQNIGYKTYYRWEREILQIAGKELTLTSREKIAKPVFTELPALASTPEKRIVATVRIGAASVDVYSGADAELITALCRALSHAE